MSTTNLQEKLQQAYHTMLDTVGTLVAKEGKTVREALDHAEESIHEWGELSKEEISNVSDEVKHDLRSLGQTLSGAKKAFKEQIKLDKRYLAESTWNKLSKIADRGTLQLIQFQESLQESVREITEAEQEADHHDHQHWHSDHVHWLDEIDHWQKSHEETKKRLDIIKIALSRHAATLEEHKQVILSHEASNHQHESIMKNTTKDPGHQIAHEKNEEQDLIHAQEKNVHSQHAKFHNFYKSHHRNTTALVNKLFKEMQQFRS